MQDMHGIHDLHRLHVRHVRARLDHPLRQESFMSRSKEPGTEAARPLAATRCVGRPLKAIRAACLNCTAGSYDDIRTCPMTDCALHPYRMGKRPPKGTTRDTPLKAMRRYWLWLCNGSTVEIRETPMTAHPLYAYRMGRRPGRFRMRQRLLPKTTGSEGSRGRRVPRIHHANWR